MKRALLIAGGTLGGLGAVMAITPPQFSSTDTMALGGATGVGAIGGSTPASTPAATQSATASATATAAKPTATKSKATTKAVTTKKPAATKSDAAQATASATATATATAAQATASATATATATATAAPAPAPVSKGVTGTFVGPAIYVNYGTVQVQIVVKDGKITDATALQAPTGRNSRWTDMAVPQLRKQTLAAQSDAIQGASGASYTSYGWYKSLQGALAKAGL